MIALRARMRLVLVHRMGRSFARSISARIKAADGGQPVVIDLRNIYPPEEVLRHGFAHVAVGRSA